MLSFLRSSMTQTRKKGSKTTIEEPTMPQPDAAPKPPVGTKDDGEVSNKDASGEASGASKATGRVGTTESEKNSTVQNDPCGKKAHNDVLDVCFVCDCTGSMGSYIRAAQDNIRGIMEKITAFEQTDARFGLVAYRDHPPQDATFITRTFSFTSSRRSMQENVDWMQAAGGGDGPEAVTAALKAALEMDWRKDAAKVVVLIADAPPHGLGETGDGFPNGCPDGNDPLDLAKRMRERGIVCYPVGCEPALGSFMYARDFLVTLASITEGQAVPLSSAALLADVIIGGAQEEVHLERLLETVQLEVEAEQQAHLEAGGVGRLGDEVVCARVQSKLAARGLKTLNLRHNGKIRAPNAKSMSEKATLAEWRTEAPQKPTIADDLFCESLHAASSLSLTISTTSRKSIKKKSKSKAFFSRRTTRATTGHTAELTEDAYDFMDECARKDESAGATSTWVEEDIISPEQVMRCYAKSKAKGLY